MYAKLPELFGRLPKNKLDVVPMESFRSASSPPADYSIGAGDGSRPGRINVNEYAPEKRLLLNVEAIAYHEGRSRTSLAIFDCAGVDRPAAVS
jgi:uncharacterized protein (DUF885 family)